LESLGKEKTNEQKKINKQTQKQIKNPRQIWNSYMMMCRDPASGIQPLYSSGYSVLM
jgi:hypothetical protein